MPLSVPCKKWLLVIPLIFISVSVSLAQLPSFPNNPAPISNASTLTSFAGPVTSLGYKLKSFADTTAANLVPYLKFTPNIIINSGDNIYKRSADTKRWLLVGGANTTSNIDSVTVVNNQICYWKLGGATCYNINNTQTYYGIDSITFSGEYSLSMVIGCFNLLYHCSPGNPVGGVDSVTVSGNTFCQWVDGDSTCYTFTGGSTLTTSVDSITVNGSNFCSWDNGVSTCYTISQDSYNTQYIYRYVDSSIDNSVTQYIYQYIDTAITLNYFTSFYGVDSVKFDTATKNLCVYYSGAPTCYMITSNAPPLTTGVDSVIVIGNQLCQYSGGVPTCYTVTNTINQYIQNLIDSSSTVNNFYTTNNSAKISGEVIYDSLLVFHGTAFNYYINGRNFTSPLTYVTLADPFASEDRTDVFYVDTLGNFGVLTGGAGGLVPQTDPASQLAVATVFVPSAGSGTVIDVRNIGVYFENIEWIGTSNVAGVNFDYLTNPYQGLKSVYVPNYTNNQFLKFTGGSTLSLSDVTFVKFQIRLLSPFRTGNKDYLSVRFMEGANSRSSYEPVLSGTHGFDRTITNAWQEVTIPISEFTYSTTTFDGLYFNLTGAGSFQLDNVQIQTGKTGVPINVGQYVETVNGQYGPNTFVIKIDSVTESADTSKIYYWDKRTGKLLDSSNTHLKYSYYDTCFVVTTPDSINFFVAFNRNCGGSGGIGGSGTVNAGTANRLGYYATTGSAISQLAAITASRALVSDANGLPVASLVTATELGYSSGVTSGIQAQIDAKLSSFTELDPVWLADKPNYLTSAIAASTYAVIAHNHTIDGLSNVTITGKASGDILRWNGTVWANFVPPWITSYTETDPKRVTGVAITGTTLKTVTITLADATTVAGTFTDDAGGGSAEVKQVHTTGATVTVSNTTTWLISKPALAALTVTLPATPVDFQTIIVSFKAAVTALVVSPNTGQTISGSGDLGEIAAGETIIYKYDITDAIWYRTQ